MKKLLIIILVLLVSACVSAHGDKRISDKQTALQIKPGTSTKADVKQLVGEPMEVEFTDTGDEIWKYVYSKAKIRGTSFIPFVGLLVGGADTETNTITVRFNKEGTVKRVGSGHTTGGGGGLQDLKR